MTAIHVPDNEPIFGREGLGFT